MRTEQSNPNIVESVFFGLHQVNPMSNYEHFALVLTDAKIYLIPSIDAPKTYSNYIGYRSMTCLDVGPNLHAYDIKIKHNKSHKGFHKFIIFDDITDTSIEMTYTPFEKKNNKAFYSVLESKHIKVIKSSKDYKDTY